jgi:PIN domain nuclease of toxin-antitoxin system
MTDQPAILLDTCALIFVANATHMNKEAEAEISEAAYDGRLYVSPMSAWEIGIGVAKNRLKLPLEPLEFFQRFLTFMQAQLSAVSPEILIGSSNLPGNLHGDPMDRILISTARNLDMVLVTRDGPILDYGTDGHLRTLAC